MSRWSSVRKAERTAVLNGFGISLGDSIIGLQALFAAQRLGSLGRPTLFRRIDCRPMVQAIYGHAADLADLGDLTDRIPPGFDEVIDIRDFAFDPAFRGVAMIDFFLRHLGVDPAAVPTSLLRNSWLAPRVRPVAPTGLPERYVLVCPESSMALRDMPADVRARIVRTLAERQDLPVLTQGSAVAGAGVAPHCGSFAELCGLVAGAACMVSTDTAMLHMADAFAVPCLAVFTTHRPEWRMRDYPLCEALYLPVDGLPEALEFSRGDNDLRAVAATWSSQADMIVERLVTFLRRQTVAA